METAPDPKHPHFVLPTLPGQPIPPETEKFLKSRISAMLGCNASRFPGAQPVSFTRQHVEILKQKDFFVAEKSDGIRCLLLATVEDGVARTILIDRKNEYKWVPEVVLPLPSGRPRPDQVHNGTVVDGELVCDVERDGRVVTRYLAFDLLSLNGEKYTTRPLTKRLGVLKQNVVKPHKQFLDSNPDYAAQAVFSIEMKEQQVAYGISRVLNLDIPNLKHGNDGLIFTEIFTPYVVGSTDSMLKWKPPSENSVDFRVRVVQDEEESEQVCNDPSAGGVGVPGSRKRSRDDAAGGDGDPGDAGCRERKKRKPDLSNKRATPKLELYVQGKGKSEIFWGEMVPTLEEWQTMNADGRLGGRIVECRYSPERGGWVFMRFRDDKPDPNYLAIAEKIMESIRDGVESEELVKAEPEIRSNWKSRDPIRPEGLPAKRR